jgi:ATPase subunit of ABC transporter with duplicated ATPase domains
MQTQEMRQAMSTLKVFSEKERAYHSYQARQNYLREQRSVQRQLEAQDAEIEAMRIAREQAFADMEKERVAKEEERAAKEMERMAKEKERAAKEQALLDKDKEQAAKEDALAEIERLKRLLGDREGRDPVATGLNSQDFPGGRSAKSRH